MHESVARQKPIVAVVSTRWCRHCRRLQTEAFCNPALAARICQRFVPLLIDADQQPELVRKLNVTAIPTVLIISPDRKILGRYAGFQSAAQLEARLALFQTPGAR